MKSIPHAPTTPVAAFPSDPILIALARHRDAWAWLVHAPAEERTAAARAQVDALADVLATPCTTAAGAGCLLRHLRPCLAPAGTALGLAPQPIGLITARAADLSLLRRPRTDPPRGGGCSRSPVPEPFRRGRRRPGHRHRHRRHRPDRGRKTALSPLPHVETSVHR